MKNITTTVEDEVARWARVWAARSETSLSRLVSERLRCRMREDQGYEQAMQRYLAVQPTPLKAGGRYPKREELHER